MKTAWTRGRAAGARRRPARAWLSLLALAPAAASAAPYLLRDINLQPGSAMPSAAYNILDLDGVALFSAQRSGEGREPWRSDGTPGGTAPLADLEPGSCSSSPRPLAAAGGIAYLEADVEAYGRELWRTDGTAAGTWLVKDVYPGPSSLGVVRAATAGARVFFVESDGSGGEDLWVSDGTAAGTRKVMDVALPPPVPSGTPTELTALGDRLLFVYNDGQSGAELWASDGTPGGTALVLDIYPGSGSSGPTQLTAAGTRVFFHATDPSGGNELWASDGTAAGTYRVKDIQPGSGHSWITGMVAMGGEVYLAADDGVHGSELWKSDGTEAGTVLLSDIRPGAAGSAPAHLATAGGRLFFSAADGVHGQDLWVSDGTPAGTLGLDVAPGPGILEIDSITGGAGRAFVVAYYGGYNLWVSDGTPAGTELWAGHGFDLHFTAVGSLMFFASVDPSLGPQLFRSDGTLAGTYPVTTDSVPGTADSDPNSMVDLNGALFLSASDGDVRGARLWRSDGTPAGTEPADLAGAPTVAANLTAIGGSLYFNEAGVMVSEGQDGDARLLTSSVGGFYFTPLAGEVIFSGFDSMLHSTLWKTDGTPAGTAMVADLNPGSTDVRLDQLTAVSGNVYFVTDDGVSGYELWKSDGTAAGTTLVKDVFPGSRGCDPRELTVFDGALYFGASDSQWVSRLWRSDGTAAGTVSLGPSSSSPAAAASRLRVAGGNLFFQFDNGLGAELWRTDGRTAPTLVKDIEPGLRGSLPDDLTDVAGTLYFSAESSATSRRALWRSDGSEAGTVLVKDVWPDNLCAVGDRLFFTALDPGNGYQLWVSDGTDAGTRPIPIFPGECGVDPKRLTVSGDHLFLAADDGQSGLEPWALDLGLLLRFSGITSLDPLTPPRDQVFPLLAARDRYLPAAYSGEIEAVPPPSPLVLYEIEGEAVLRLTKIGAAIRLDFTRP